MPTFTLRFTVDQRNGKPVTIVDYVEVVVDCYKCLAGSMDEYNKYISLIVPLWKLHITNIFPGSVWYLLSTFVE